MTRAHTTPGSGARAGGPVTRPNIGTWWQAMTSPWTLLMVLTCAVMAMSACRPLGDVDIFWHVRVGYDIVAHHRFTGDPNWVYGPSGNWTTTQWASEVLFAGLHHLFGWRGLMVFNAACGALLLHVLAWLLREITGKPVHAAPTTALVFAATGTSLALALQERPAMISYILLMVVSVWAWRILTTRRYPHWWATAGLTLFWAQFHGYWVMVPMVLTLAGLFHLAHARSRQALPPMLLHGAVASLAGAFTPAGLYGYVAPVAFRNAAHDFIPEWRHPEPTDPNLLIALTLVLGCVSVHLFRNHVHKVPLTMWVWVAVWALFGWSAMRNVIPATLLVLPALTAMLAREPLSGTGPSTQRAGTWVSAMAAITVIVATLGGMAWTLTTKPVIASEAPLALIRHLTTQPGDRYVFNHYDASGYLLGLSDPDRIHVYIDSRSDKYGHDRIGAAFDILRTRPGWQEKFTTYPLTDALIQRGDPLNQSLPGLGWELVGTEGNYVLWTAARQPGQETHQENRGRGTESDRSLRDR